MYTVSTNPTQKKCRPGPEVIKKISCSAEHEILNVQKYKNIKIFNVFLDQIGLLCYFSCP